jgi:hypothetical protein
MSRDPRMVTLDRPRQVVATGPPCRAERFPLDYASWRAHLAAPGSRFEAASSASLQIIHLKTVIWSAASAGDQRRTA